MKKSLGKLVLPPVLCLGGGWLSGFSSDQAVCTWYQCLEKSSLTPPSIIFPVVWTILYIMMGFSFGLLWKIKKKKKGLAYFLFGGQLFCNLLWSWLFFGRGLFLLAFLDMALLLAFLMALLFLLWRLTRFGFLLLVPYFAWILFAFYLNGYVWIHN